MGDVVDCRLAGVERVVFVLCGVFELVDFAGLHLFEPRVDLVGVAHGFDCRKERLERHFLAVFAVVFPQVFVVSVPVRRAEEVARERAAVDDLEAAFGRFGFDFLLFEKFVGVVFESRVFRRSLVFKGQVERLCAIEGLYRAGFVGEVFRENHEPVVLF